MSCTSNWLRTAESIRRGDRVLGAGRQVEVPKVVGDEIALSLRWTTARADRRRSADQPAEQPVQS